MKTKLIFVSVAILSAVPAFSQGIDQSVEVTNEYETRFSDFHKRTVAESVPDSLYRFDYNFDYSVFDSPYKGSYDFTPYQIKLTPEPVPYDGRALYARAGAGYSLHPVLDLAYTPLSEKNVGVSLYNHGAGYAGDTFHDLSDEAGVSGHYHSRIGRLSFGGGYSGIFAGDGIANSFYNSAGVSVGLTSPDREGTAFLYRIGASYRYGGDRVSAGRVGEHLLGVDGSFGPIINGRYSVLLDFDFTSAMIKDGLTGFSDRPANFAALTPHIRFVLGPADVDAGVQMDYLSASSGSLTLAPAVRASLEVRSLDMKFLAGIGGGRKLNSLYSMKHLNHFYLRQTGPDASRDKIDFYGGAQGRIGQSFQYDLKGGYVLRAGSPLDAPSCGLGFADYRQSYVDLKMVWLSERFNADADLHFSDVQFDNQAEVYAPAMFSGDMRLTYNWMGRVYAGLAAQGASSRSAASPSLQDLRGYVDVGLFGEYKIDRMWGVWAHAGNLACMKIERHPGYVEKGPYFTVGLSLSL